MKLKGILTFFLFSAAAGISALLLVSCTDRLPDSGGPEKSIFNLGRVDSLNNVCNYVSDIVRHEDGSMEIVLLRDSESIVVSADDIEAGLKVEDKVRYLVFSMAGHEDVILGSDMVMPYNPPLRRTGEGNILNILCIGNSLTGDTVEHLPRIMKDMGIENVNIDVIYHGGWSLLNHWNNFKVKNTCSRYIYEAGEPDWTEFNPNLLDDCGADVLALREYDVVTFQDQTRSMCNVWTEDEKAAFLDMVRYIQNACPEHRPSLVYFAPHIPAAKLYSGNNAILWELFEGDQARCLESYLARIKDILANTPVDMFFSNATAVQNLRTSELNRSHPLDLSRDGTHSDYGVTRFCESAMFFQSVLKPCLGADIFQSRYVFEKSDGTPGKYSTPVNDETRPVALEAAKNALAEPFVVTRMSAEEPPLEGMVNYVLKLCDYPLSLTEANGGACSIKNAGEPEGLDWEVSGEAHDKFVITNGSANGRYKIGQTDDYVDPFVLRTAGLSGKKVSKVSVWMSSGVNSKRSSVSVCIGGKEYMPLTETGYSTAAVKNTGFEYSVDCDSSAEGEVEITVRSSAAFYMYKIYIDYMSE